MGIMGAREAQILSTIIEHYITTATPVASQTVVALSGLALSSASIRAVMANLTERGYLEQPHTSAGRIPTIKAFRLYVDELLRSHVATGASPRLPVCTLNPNETDMGALLQQVSTQISNYTQQVTMLLAPDTQKVRLRSLHFVPSGSHTILAVLMLEGGIAKTRILHVKQHYQVHELERFTNYINMHYHGFTLLEMREAIREVLSTQSRQLEELAQQALHLGQKTLRELGEQRELVINGTHNIIGQVEFADTTRMRELLETLDDHSVLLSLLDTTIDGNDIHVMFPQHPSLRPRKSLEAHVNGLRGCSVVSAPYNTADNQGVISIVGPLRMNYRMLLPLVRSVSRSLSQHFEQRFANS